MRINVTPSQLKAVLAVADTGSFTAAASKVGLSQPALSRIVRGVEAELGCSIFDRDTRNVSATAVGETLLRTIRTTLTDFDGALVSLRNQALGRSGVVRVAALPSLAQALLAPAMVEMRMAAPDVEVSILDALSEIVIRQVAEGQVDFGLVDRPSGQANLTYHDLISDKFGLVCRSDDPLAARKTVEWTVFEHRPFISMATGSSVRALIDAAMSQAQLTVRPLFEPAFLATVGSLVATHAGITALPNLAFQSLQEGLIWRPLQNPVITRSSGYIVRSDREPQAAAVTLLNLLKKVPTPG